VIPVRAPPSVPQVRTGIVFWDRPKAGRLIGPASQSWELRRGIFNTSTRFREELESVDQLPLGVLGCDLNVHTQCGPQKFERFDVVRLSHCFAATARWRLRVKGRPAIVLPNRPLRRCHANTLRSTDALSRHRFSPAARVSNCDNRVLFFAVSRVRCRCLLGRLAASRYVLRSIKHRADMNR